MLLEYITKSCLSEKLHFTHQRCYQSSVESVGIEWSEQNEKDSNQYSNSLQYVKHHESNRVPYEGYHIEHYIYTQINQLHYQDKLESKMKAGHHIISSSCCHGNVPSIAISALQCVRTWEIENFV